MFNHDSEMTKQLKASKYRRSLRAFGAATIMLAIGVGTIQVAAFDETENIKAETDNVILPGSSRFKVPDFEDYQAVYSSSSSKSGGFTLQARKSAVGKNLSLIDIIPMKDNVIVAQRNIDIPSMRMNFYAGPYFAWGADFIVGQSNQAGYDWSRVPIGGGEPKRMTGEIAHKGYVSEMFSPLLASLLPLDVGAKVKIPGLYPRQGDVVSSELDTYTVLRKERLETPSGLSCECYVIERQGWDETVDHIWVAGKAPFVFRRHRGVGSEQAFVSDLLDFKTLGY